MANTQQPAANATPPGPPPSTAVAPNEEQRIAEQRLADLQKQASDAAAGEQAAKSDANALRGELERKTTELAGLKASNERLVAENRSLLEASNAREQLPALSVDLPKGAFQLTESVTIAALGDNGKPVRANAKRGDLVFVGPKGEALDELQSDIGLVARVYPIDRATADELRTLKYIR